MRTLFVFVMVFFATITHAQVVVTEIMYDPEGADTGHEWIEIKNRGSEPVTIEDGKSGWKLFEDGTNHTLTSVRGGTTLGAGSYAIIVDNADNFLADNPSFDGYLFDSSFSLKNTGETIALKNSSGEEESSLTYDPTLGANGDGSSLQENNNVWIVAAPTPGAGAPGVGAANISSETSSSSGPSEISSSGGVSSSGVPTLSLRVQNAAAIVGAPYVFEPRAGGGAQEAYLQWSFGDGSTSATWGSQSVSHTYYYSGTYTVFLEAPELNLSTKLSVRAVLPAIAVTAHGDTNRSFITIENRGREEVNLEKWQLLANGSVFTFPKLVIAARQSVRLPSEVTRLVTPEGMYVELRFPGGARVPIVIAEEIPTRDPVVIAPIKPSTSIPPRVIVAPAPQPTQELLPELDTSYYKEGTSTFSMTSQGAVLLEGDGDDDRAWQWYTGVALIALLALFGLRFARARQTPADEYEIVEDNDEM